VEKIVSLGGIAVEFEPLKINLEGFSTLLSSDMKVDLPSYLDKYASDDILVRSISDIADFNMADTLVRIPYGQTIFDEMVALEITPEEVLSLKKRLHEEAVRYFDKPMTEMQLDVILSVNNRNAGTAAAAFHPCLTVPMGYRSNGAPAGITFISRPFEEALLLKIGYAFEQATKLRIPPGEYK